MGWRDFEDRLHEFQILEHFCPNLVSLLGSGVRMLPALLLTAEMKSFWLLVIYALPWIVLETIFLYEEYWDGECVIRIKNSNQCNVTKSI